MDDQLSKQIQLYNEYVEERLKLIYDFDVWYEHTTGSAFPKEWYSMIRANGQNTV